MAYKPLEVTKNAIIAIGNGVEPVHRIGTGQVEAVFGDFRFIVVEEEIGLRAEEFGDVHVSIQCSVFAFRLVAYVLASFNEPAGLVLHLGPSWRLRVEISGKGARNSRLYVKRPQALNAI
jgi:hypothetical protein